VPLEIQKRVWGVEEFEAALSYVPVAEGEDDLFAGLGSPAEANALATRGDLTIVHDGRVADEPEAHDAQERASHAQGDSSDTHSEDDGSTGKADD
jgi:mycothiol S-conjugate amidase